MVQSTFTDLLNKSEGLTEQFKQQASQMFEQAVTDVVEERLAQQKEALMHTVAKEGAQTIKQEIDRHITDLNEQYKQKYAELLEAKQQAESKLIKESDRYSSNLAILEEKFNAGVEKAVEAHNQEFKENISTLVDRLDSWLDYAANQYVKENEIALADQAKVWASEQMIQSLSECFRKFGAQPKAADDGFMKKLDAAQKDRDLAYQRLAEQVEAKSELEHELEEAKKALAVQTLTEHMTQTDRIRVISLLEGDTSSYDDFINHAKRIISQLVVTEETAHPITESLASVNIVSDTPIEETAQEAKQGSHERVADPDVEYFYSMLQRRN